jgi:hypothetical protein
VAADVKDEQLTVEDWLLTSRCCHTTDLEGLNAWEHGPDDCNRAMIHLLQRLNPEFGDMLEVQRISRPQRVHESIQIFRWRLRVAKEKDRRLIDEESLVDVNIGKRGQARPHAARCTLRGMARKK